MRATANATACALLATAISAACLTGTAAARTAGPAAPDGVEIIEPCDGCAPQAAISPSALADIDGLTGLTMEQARERVARRHPGWRVEWMLADRLDDDGRMPLDRPLNADDLTDGTSPDQPRVERAELSLRPDGRSWTVTARISVADRAAVAERETDWRNRRTRAACETYMHERYPWGVSGDGTASVTGNPSGGWLVSGRMDVTNKYNATALHRPYRCRISQTGTDFTVTAFDALGDWDEDTAR